MPGAKWPKRLTIVRHGQSAANAALDAAMAAHSLTIDLKARDADVPLSAVGQEQARALGLWFGTVSDEAKPTILITSPFLRAVQTAEVVERVGSLKLDCPVVIDERVREREFGRLDGYTVEGIRKAFPEEAALRDKVGKFYYRPPGGESWCDVVLRLRSAMDSISLHYTGENVVIVAHQVIVLCLRYLLEKLTEEQVLAIDREGDVANCSLTQYVLQDKKLVLDRYNYVVPMTDTGAPVTAEPTKNKRGA